MKIFQQRPWCSAYGISIGLHIAAFAVIAIFATSKPSIGADGLITVDLIGAGGGETGGLGYQQMPSPKGEGGTNGDNRRLGSTNQISQTDRHEQEKLQNGLISQITQSESKGEELKNERNFSPLKSSTPKDEPIKALATSSDQPPLVKQKENKPQPQKLMPNNRLEKRPDVKQLTGEKHIKDISQHTSKDGETKGQKQISRGGLGGIAGSVGALSRQEGQTLSGQGQGSGTGIGSGAYISNGDGSFTAMSAKGLDYKILFERPAQYPKQARAIGYAKTVKVTVRFLVGIDGRVEQIEVLTKDLPNLGFEEAALKSIRSMQFAPIQTPSRQPLKVWFKKTIIFKK